MTFHLLITPPRLEKLQISTVNVSDESSMLVCYKGLNIKQRWKSKCSSPCSTQKPTLLFQDRVQTDLCKLIWKGKLSCRLREFSANCSNDLSLSYVNFIRKTETSLIFLAQTRHGAKNILPLSNRGNELCYRTFSSGDSPSSSACSIRHPCTAIHQQQCSIKHVPSQFTGCK